MKLRSRFSSNISACIIIVLLSLNTLSDAHAQSMWQRMKDKASSAWNSDTRKKAWEKTKQVASKVSDSKIAKSAQYQVPIVGRTFYNFIPDKYITELGASQYQKYINASRRSTNSRQTAQVSRVANRLISATKQMMAVQGRANELSNYSWAVNLVSNNTANAFCMPGGKIVVYDGILPLTVDDASLACVLGHEIAHAIAKHSSEQMTKALITSAGMATLYAIISSSDMSYVKKRIAALLAAAGVTLANLKFSRIDETEADRLGLILAAMAGYNPNSAVTFWQRMANKEKQTSVRDWYSTHPSHANRISNIRSFLPEALKYYKKR